MFKKGKEKKKKITLMDLEEQGSKLDINVQSGKTEKKLKPTTVAALKGVRYFIYGSLIFTLAVGTFQILRSKQPKHVTNIVEYNFAPSESITAQSFGLAFAKEYLTYSRDTRENNYQQRVMPFMLSALVDSIKPELSKGSSKVIDALVWKVEKLDTNHSNVIVRAEVETINDVDVETKALPTGEVETQPRIQSNVIYLSVPVGYYEGSYIVDDYPSFVPTPEHPTKVRIQTFSAESLVMDQEKEEIKEVLSNFFKTYTTGNEGQISYYMENNQKTKGYEGNYIFDSIRALEAYSVGQNEVVAVAQILIKDAELNTTFVQRFTFELVKKSEQNKARWYIKEFSQRGNLYEDQDILRGGI